MGNELKSVILKLQQQNEAFQNPAARMFQATDSEKFCKMLLPEIFMFSFNKPGPAQVGAISKAQK